MTFTNLVAFWLALAIPVVVFAFLVRRKLRRRVVPTLFLWEEALGKSLAKARSFQFRDAMSLLVALLITLALILSALEPNLGDVERGATIYVLDNSASMNAVEFNGKTRFVMARNALERAIANKNEDVEALVLTTAGAPSIVSGFTRDAAALRRAIASVEPSDRACAANETLELARFFQQTRGEDCRVVFLSDGCFDGAAEFEQTLAAANVRFERIGEKLNNVGVKTFNARRSPIGDAAYDVTLEVVNDGDNDVSFDVEIGLNDVLVDLIPMALAPNERVLRTLKYESVDGGTLSATLLFGADMSNDLNPDNRLTADDARTATLPDFPELNVLVLGEQNRFLQLVLESQPNVKTEFISTVPTTLDKNTLLVVVGVPPAELPQGKIAFLAPSADCDLFLVEDDAVDTTVEPGVVESPLTCFLDLENAPLHDVRTISPVDGVEFEVFARTPESPVIFAVHDSEAPNLKRWCFNFSCTEDSIVLRTLFPILFANLIGAARGTDETAFALEEPQNDAEFDLRTRIGVEKVEGKNIKMSSALVKTSLWKFFAAFALILATLEFYWYCRRRV